MIIDEQNYVVTCVNNSYNKAYVDLFSVKMKMLLTGFENDDLKATIFKSGQ